MKTRGHYIILTKKRRRIHNTVRAALIISFIFCGALFVRELIFPTHVFNFKASIDSLANTISRPYISEHGTGFDIATHGDFTHATITFTLPKDAPELPNDTQIIARKSYGAFLSHLSTQKYTAHTTQTIEIDDQTFIQENDVFHPIISKNAFDSYLFNKNTILTEDELSTMSYTLTDDTKGFAPATLIASKEGIFVTDGTTKHPFQDELVFTALGYNFDNVIKSTSEERSMHKKARMMDIKSTHPFGTIFFAQETGNMYIYDNDQIHKVNRTVTAKKHAIITDERSRSTFASCTITKKPLSARTYTCTMPLAIIESFPGNMYQFIITTPDVAIEHSRITLSKAPTEKSFSLRVQELKKELSKIYMQQ